MPSVRFYRDHYQALFEPMIGLMRHGVKIDRYAAKKHRHDLERECMEIQKQLEEFAGTPLHGPKDLASKKIQWFLYTYLGFPRLFMKGKQSADETRIRKCIQRAQRLVTGELQPVLKKKRRLYERKPRATIKMLRALLRHREAAKEAGVFGRKVLDPDHRYRSRYIFGPYTGRFASRKNPYDTGGNAQNIKRNMRHLVLPDDGCVFLELDYSQAESRGVYIQTGDPYMMTLARAKPWEHDDHSRTAGMIFLPDYRPTGFVPKGSLPITKDQRQFGKKTRHARHYGEGGKRMSDDLLDEDIVKSPRECDQWLRNLADAEPPITQWQLGVIKDVLRTGYLHDRVFGARVDVTNMRPNDELYRIAFAFQGQAPIGRMLNFQGLVPLFNWIRDNGMRSRINLQVHDALVISCPPREIWRVFKFLKASMEQPNKFYSPVTREYYKLSIPTEAFVGKTWDKKSGREFDRLPARSELEDYAAQLLDERQKEAA